MLASRFHSFSWHNPNPLFQIYFRLFGADDLASSGGGQDRKFKRLS